MSVNVEHKNPHFQDDIGWARELSSPALDAVWKEAWLRDGIGSKLENLVREIEKDAGAMRFRCDRILVVAEGAVADLLQSLLPSQGNKVRLRLLRPSLAAGDLSREMEWLDEMSAGLIGISLGPESPAFCAVFATLRKLIAGRYSEEKKARLKVITGPRSVYLAEELKQGDMEGYAIPPEYDPGHELDDQFQSDLAAGHVTGCMGASIAMLFPMMVAGVDAGAYVRGFREMLSSPWWDQDADELGLLFGSNTVSMLESGEPVEEEFLCWQPEMAGICRWLAAVRREWAAARALSMPEEAPLHQENVRPVTILCREEAADIMLPFFPGVNPEGSMNQMLREAAGDLAEWTKGTLIYLDKADPEDLGRLVAYLQLTCGIAGWISRNHY